MESIISDIHCLFQETLEQWDSSKMQHSSSEVEARDDVVQTAVAHVSEVSLFTNIFSGLVTHYRQLKCFKQEFGLIVGGTHVWVEHILHATINCI